MVDKIDCLLLLQNQQLNKLYMCKALVKIHFQLNLHALWMLYTLTYLNVAHRLEGGKQEHEPKAQHNHVDKVSIHFSY